MTRADPERIYTRKATLGFKMNLKESTWAMYPTITIVFGYFSMSSWLNEFSSQMCKCETSRILFFSYIFQQSQACAGFILESQLKSKFSHSLIHMGFIGLVTWSGVRGLWKKGLERPKECLRVILSKNLESVACTFIHSNFWVGLYSFFLIH